MKNNADGGFLDDGSSQDPVSGNEVPTGSLAEEVRDDIPAQLSEGEFVVPADVVRFIGLEKLMKMRDAAKNGLASMEAEGQIGGSSAPMQQDMGLAPEMDEAMEMDALIDGMDSDDFEGVAQNYAHGGSVHLPSYQQYTGRKEATPDIIQQTRYVNAAGDIIVIPTLKGDPLKLVPEGYFLYVEPEDGSDPVPQPIEDGGVAYQQDTNNLQSAQDKEERFKDIVTSNRLHRERIGSLTEFASFDMSQEESNAMFAQLTPQAREIYNSRFKVEADRGLIDGFMSKGKSPADLMIVAQKTADAMNNQRGIIDYDPNASHVPEPGALARGLKYLGMGIISGAMGPIGIALKGMSDEEKETVKSTFEALKGVITQIGEPSPFGNSDGEGNLPSGSTGIPEGGYNQAYWAEKLQKGTLAGNTNIQKDLFLEQQTVAGRTGKDIYGNTISGVNPSSATEIIAKKYRAEEEKLNTIRLMAEEKAAKKAAAKKEADRQDAIIRDTAKKADNDAADSTPTPPVTDPYPATQTLSNSTVNNNDGDGDGPKGNNSGPVGGSTSGPKSRGGKQRQQRSKQQNSGKEVTAGTTGKNTTGKSFNYGGLVSPSKPKIKKMRKDPTSGLASKKIAKQKAQAKKGALAAKRT